MPFLWGPSLETVVNTIGRKYNLTLEVLANPTIDAVIIRDVETGVANQITKREIVGLDTPMETAKQLEYIIQGINLKATTIKASKYDAMNETTKNYLRYAQTFSYAVPFEQQSVTVKPKRISNVMPETKKRAITLEE
jgi:hypothetical protein